MGELGDAELVLPEREFTYTANGEGRPWSHFLSRWEAIRTYLERALEGTDSERPLRIIDLGSCNGFFSLQTAAWLPEADVVGIEGSVGIGNGTTGMAGTARQICSTSAVQTHLRWIQKLKLTNCFVAPEVWDYQRICDLGEKGRPIADCIFSLSVIHHIDNVSIHQYERAGFTRAAGTVNLIAKLLLLSSRHVIELPNRPWMKDAFDTYGTARGILEAAAVASGREWMFRGPICKTEWFGIREVWVLEPKVPMPEVDLTHSPMPLLFRGEESEMVGDLPDDPVDVHDAGARGPVRRKPGPPSNYPQSNANAGLLDQTLPLGGGLPDPVAEAAAMGLLTKALHEGSSISSLTSCKALGGALVDPGMMLLQSLPRTEVDPSLAEIVASAPTELLLAHLTLREALAEADEALELRRAARQHKGAHQLPHPPGHEGVGIAGGAVARMGQAVGGPYAQPPPAMTKMGYGSHQQQAAYPAYNPAPRAPAGGPTDYSASYGHAPVTAGGAFLPMTSQAYAPSAALAPSQGPQTTLAPMSHVQTPTQVQAPAGRQTLAPHQVQQQQQQYSGPV